jgi:3-oxoadipyl-CoA thiolase
MGHDLVPVEVLEKKGPTIFERDQQPRVDNSEETLARLRPPFKESGLVTAGNETHRHWRPLPNAGAECIFRLSKERQGQHGSAIRALHLSLLAHGA